MTRLQAMQERAQAMLLQIPRVDDSTVALAEWAHNHARDVLALTGLIDVLFVALAPHLTPAIGKALNDALTNLEVPDAP